MNSPDVASQGARSDRSSFTHTPSHSISSDIPSVTGFTSLQSPPAMTTPEPMFVAASAASQIVQNNHDSNSDTWFDQHGIEPSGETALVSPGALRLVNMFLDQLLFNFLSISRSTSLASLRPAVAEVLKRKLAKDAISQADQELLEYLGGGEDEELLAFHNGIEPSGDWDLELVWKRTRLRCMVYSSLGDMEEEDEDLYTEEQLLNGPSGRNNRFSNQPGVSPAVAIFLTSILEFMGEQALVIAGHAAYHRLRAKQAKDERDGMSIPHDIADRVVVEDIDMERVALDRTLGKLWRGWKKRIRTTSGSMVRSFSRESLQSRSPASRRNSVVNEHFPTVEETLAESVMSEDMVREYASNIPLPIGEQDVREIEIPGLAEQSDDEDMDIESEDEELVLRRPQSLMNFPRDYSEPPTPEQSRPHTPIFLSPATRKRSYSLPSPAFSPAKRQKALPETVSTEESTNEPSEQAEEIVESQDAHMVQDGKPDNTGLLTGIIAGASAIGVAAVTGIAAVARGEAPTTDAVVNDETDGEEEEPQILTSSRISMLGRMTPDHPVIVSGTSSIRSPSVESLRLVDVAPPRSPSQAGETSSNTAGGLSSSRQTSLSRSGSMRAGEDFEKSNLVSRTATASPLMRSASTKSKALTTSADEPTSEAGEQNIQTISNAVEVPQRSPLRETLLPVLSQTSTSLERKDSGSSQLTVLAPTSQEIPFILAAAPTPRHSREVPAASVNGIIMTDSSAGELSPKFRDSTGVPPLTPLREMVEGAPDTSDEASSTTPSYDAQGVTDMPNVSPLNISPKQNTHGRMGSRSVTGERPIPRSAPAVASREDDTMPKLEAYNKTPPRPPRTSASSGSSFTSNKLKAVRTSEDSVAPNIGDDKSRSFEQLIKSDQTIQYTLTPQSMRQIEGAQSQPNGGIAGDSVSSRARTDSNLSASQHRRMSSNPPLDVPRSPRTPSSPNKNFPVQPIPSPLKTSPRPRTNGPQARGARVERDSTGDFSDFIRSTGPPGSLVESPLTKGPVVDTRVNSIVRNGSHLAPHAATTAVLPKRSASSANRLRLQARDAVIPYGDRSADLIEFIRQGPPNENSPNKPQISRTVAPFRSTMDSDQMPGAAVTDGTGAPESAGRYSQASTSLSAEQSMQSMHSSINSQSALLSSARALKSSPIGKFDSFEEEDMMPKRKTRRVKDPYAIDLSDEEDEIFGLASAVKPKRQEESLVDFLNNVTPPPPAPVQPILLDTDRKLVTKKSSGTSLMSRFSRPGSVSSNSKPFSSSTNSRTGSRSNAGASQIRGHVPITPEYSPSSDHTQASAYTPRNANYISQLDTERKPVSGRAAQKAYQPRDPTSVITTRTGDLADFLMNTPPPPSNAPQPLQSFQHSPKQKEEKGLSRMFGRKKKVPAS